MRLVPLVLLAACGGAIASEGHQDAGSASDAPLDVVSLPDAAPVCAPSPPVSCDLSKPFGAPVNVTDINTPVDDAFLRLSCDGLDAYYCRLKGSYFELYTSHRSNIAAPFGASTPLQLGPAPGSSLSPTVTGDGLTLYFEDGYDPAVNVYRSTRATTSAAFTIGQQVASNMGNPYVLPDGRVLYTDAQDTIAPRHIFRTIVSSGVLSLPMTVGELEQGGGASSPTVTPDDLTIYFIHVAPTGGLYVAHRSTVSDPFSTPQEVKELEASGGEVPDFVTPDGCSLYFHSARSGTLGGFDVWVATKPP
jgi:hypothetical protein